MRLADDWRVILRRAWSVRIALFWAALSGLFSAWFVFSEVISPWIFAGLSMLMSMAIAVARITHQPGID